MSKESNWGKPLFSGLKYCSRCCMPETNEGMQFDEMQICLACRSSEEKMHIDWAERMEQLKKLLEDYRSKDGKQYDCIVPVSGGKDSTFQLHVIKKVLGLNPLAVSYVHDWYSEVGKRNLERCIKVFDLDHIQFKPSVSTVNKSARASLVSIGDACWHCHTGIGAFPLQIALKFGIKLLIYGESPAEFSGRASFLKDKLYKTDEFNKYVNAEDGDANIFYAGREHWLNNVARKKAEEMSGKAGITEENLIGFHMPSREKLEEAGVLALFLGDFLFWDQERQTEFLVREYGWEEDTVEGTYKRYKSVECKMTGVHDYTKFLKRGFGRGTDFASMDVRAGLLTREEGFELAKKHDVEIPKKALEHYLKITGYTEEEFYKIMAGHRLEQIKKYPVDGDQS